MPTSYSKDIPDLVKLMVRFEEEIKKSSDNLSVHHLANFLYKLSFSFNRYYGETKILDEENKDKIMDLAILRNFVRLMEKGFGLLSIPVVEKM